MQKKFLKNLSLLLLLNFLIKPFWILGIDRGVQNAVGAEQYGFYFAVFNFSFLFSILLDLGISNFNNKNIAQNTQLLKKHLSGLLVLKVLLFVLYLLFTFGGALFISYSQEQLNILIFLGLNQFLVSMILYLRSNLGALHLFKTDSFVSVLDRALMVIICAALLWGNIVGEFKIQYFIYAQSVAYSITVLVVLFIVLRKAETNLISLHWNAAFFLIILRQSAPFALLVLLMAFYNRIDSVMLERMLPQGAFYAGIYAAAYRLLEAVNMIAYLFAVLLLPIFARMIKHQESVEALVKLSFKLLISPAILGAIVALIYAQPIMELLYPIHINESIIDYQYRIMETASVFGVLMSCFIAIACMYVFSTLLTANGNLRYLNYIALGGMVLNFSLNYYLIPHYHALGSAFATLITQFFAAILQIILVLSIFKFKLRTSFFVRLVFYILGSIALYFVLHQLGLKWHWEMILLLILGVFWAWIIGLLDFISILKIIKDGD